jgi:hypothetical protein
MREFCTSGSVGTSGRKRPGVTRHLYFENKSVPPLALLVSGGRLSEASVPRIERFIEENLKGKTNFHKVLILEAEAGSGAGDNARAKIELKPLTEAQQQDALFQVYDERNIDKVGSAFRLPKLLRGESKDFNRATAESALRFAEDQVFQPERDEFCSRARLRPRRVWRTPGGRADRYLANEGRPERDRRSGRRRGQRVARPRRRSRRRRWCRRPLGKTKVVDRGLDARAEELVHGSARQPEHLGQDPQSLCPEVALHVGEGSGLDARLLGVIDLAVAARRLDLCDHRLLQLFDRSENRFVKPHKRAPQVLVGHLAPDQGSSCLASIRIWGWRQLFLGVVPARLMHAHVDLTAVRIAPQ